MKLHARIALTALLSAVFISVGPVLGQAITAMVAGSAVSGADLFESVQSGNTRKVTATQIKTFTSTAPTIAGGTHTAITGLGIRSTGAAFDLTLATSEVLTAGRTLSISLGDAARAVSIFGSTTLPVFSQNITFNGATAARTYTLPDANATLLADNAAVTVAQGGTGRATSTTAYGLIAAGTTATGAHQTVSSGATTDILVGGGASALPAWTTATGTGAPVRAGSPTFTGTVGAAAITATGTIQDAIGDVRSLIQNSKSAAYTTVLSDCGKHILHPSADTTARTITIDSNANVAAPIGCMLTVVNQNAAGVLTVAVTSDTQRLAGAGTTGNRSMTANCVATWLKIVATEWIVSGGSCLT